MRVKSPVFVGFRVMAGRGRGVPERAVCAQGRGVPVPWRSALTAGRSSPAAGRGTKFQHLYSKERDQGSSITSDIRHLLGDAHRIDLRGRKVPGDGGVSKVGGRFQSVRLEDGPGSEVVKQSSVDWKGLVSAVNQPSNTLNLRQSQAGWTHYEGQVEEVVEEVDVVVEVEEPDRMIEVEQPEGVVETKEPEGTVEAKVAKLLARKDVCEAIQGIVRSINTR